MPLASTPTTARSLPKPLKRVVDLIVGHYRGLPPWVLLAQFFLAAGWQRASAAHGLDSAWWDGSQVTQFRVDSSDASIEWYRTTMLDGPVASWPVAIAIIVFVTQLIVTAMLVLNVRPLLGLAVGAGLNINIVLAGAVNPSVFYLIIGAALALWHLEASASRNTLRRLSVASSLLGALALGALLPEIKTIDPAQVIDDPAIVLSFITLLWVGALRINMTRSIERSNPRRSRRWPDDQSMVRAERSPTGDGTPPGDRAMQCRHPGNGRPFIGIRR